MRPAHSGFECPTTQAQQITHDAQDWNVCTAEATQNDVPQIRKGYYRSSATRMNHRVSESVRREERHNVFPSLPRSCQQIIHKHSTQFTRGNGHGPAFTK